MAAWLQPVPSGDAEVDALIAKHWNPWRVWAWCDRSDRGIKLGPLTIFAYLWIDKRWRIAYCWRAGMERIVFGGPLT